ncbi:MAG: transposase [Methylibium sp.]|nr:transposase [Methylibium sp.]
MELADVVRMHGPDYLAKYGARMPPGHRKALEAILGCHTPACGGSLYACDGCGARHFAWHRCGHRLCNACGHPQALAWEEAQKQRLVPVGYFLVTFTIPEELRAVFRQNQRLCYDALFGESAATLQEVAREPRHMGGDLGMLGVLHTWTRQLAYHPHVHYLVPGVALAGDGTLGFPRDPEFLLPVRKLSARFRARMRDRLRIADAELEARIPESVWRRAWVVHCKPVGRGAQAVGYLARYISKSALSSPRLLRQDARTVTFSHRDSGTGESKTLTLNGEEFLRRFLQHVLPSGWRRVRTYGWLSPAARKRFEAIHAMLTANGGDDRPARPALTVAMLCPHCQKPMRHIARIERGPPPAIRSFHPP